MKPWQQANVTSISNIYTIQIRAYIACFQRIILNTHFSFCINKFWQLYYRKVLFIY